jgi:hypothetical protein
MSLGVSARRVAEPTLYFERERPVVARTAGIGNLAEGLAYTQQHPVMQEARGLLKTRRVLGRQLAGMRNITVLPPHRFHSSPAPSRSCA